MENSCQQFIGDFPISFGLGLDQENRIRWQRQKYSINLMIDGEPGRYNGGEMVKSYER
jgi:hypothetical protein